MSIIHYKHIWTVIYLFIFNINHCLSQQIYSHQETRIELKQLGWGIETERMKALSGTFYELKQTPSNDVNSDVSCCLNRMRNNLNCICSKLHNAEDEKVTF